MTPHMLLMTGDQLVDFLASDPGHATTWVPFADLAEWETLHNLHGERWFLSRVIRDLRAQGLAQVRRVAAGRQVRLTRRGLALARERRARSDWAIAEPLRARVDQDSGRGRTGP